MAGRDNVLFYASVASGTAAGTVVPLSLLYGIENVRQGYGTAKLKNARAYYQGMYANNVAASTSVPVSVKNSNWIDAAGVIALKYNSETALNRDSLCFMRGRDKTLQPNTSWVIQAELQANTTVAGGIYLILEIEYSDVQGYDAEKQFGSPVMKHCKNGSVTAGSNAPVTLGTFDNLLQGTEYILSEVSGSGGFGADGAFLIIEGFSNQKGLVRIIPIKPAGLADQIEGSVILTKQTYNLGLISYTALTASAVDIALEMIANKN